MHILFSMMTSSSITSRAAWNRYIVNMRTDARMQRRTNRHPRSPTRTHAHTHARVHAFV